MAGWDLDIQAALKLSARPATGWRPDGVTLLG
jgi:hypothetical protein